MVAIILLKLKMVVLMHAIIHAAGQRPGGDTGGNVNNSGRGFVNATAWQMAEEAMKVCAVTRIAQFGIRTGEPVQVTAADSVAAKDSCTLSVINGSAAKDSWTLQSVKAMRLRCGSARRRGVLLSAFRVPPGSRFNANASAVIRKALDPEPPFLIFLYYALSPPNFMRASAGTGDGEASPTTTNNNSIINISGVPPGYRFASPLVGVSVYSSPDPAPQLTQLQRVNSFLSPPDTPFTITPPTYNHTPDRYVCAFFAANNGSLLYLSKPAAAPNVCSSTADLVSVHAALLQPPSPPTAARSRWPYDLPPPSAGSAAPTMTWRLALLSLIGGGTIMVVIILSILLAYNGFSGRLCSSGSALNSFPARRRKGSAEEEVFSYTILRTGHTRAPSAANVRTKPVIETLHSIY